MFIKILFCGAKVKGKKVLWRIKNGNDYGVMLRNEASHGKQMPVKHYATTAQDMFL